MMSHPLPSRASNYKKGKALRDRTPRERHSELHGPGGRDAIAILAEGDASRVPKLVPERYRRMSADPFAFLRGAAAVMASDLAHEPMAGASVQACGDCHLMNFGAFNTPEDNILFDINDFDETLPQVDFTVDLKRLAASVAVAAANANLPKKRARALAAATVASYRESMAALANLSPVEIWHSKVYLEQELDSIESRDLRRNLSKIVVKAREGGLENDDNYPHLVSGDKPRIADKPPAIFHLDPQNDTKQTFDAKRAFELYRRGLPPERLVLVERYQLEDLAFKAVGVGSVGTFCCVGLFLSGDGEPLFLQVKEAQASALERLGPQYIYRGAQGPRVVEGQRMMQEASDVFLGWTEDEASARQFYVRVLKNRRLGSISEIAEEGALLDYARLCGQTLARSHARSGEPAVIAGYMGKSGVFDDALASFAMAYSDLTASDHAALVSARGETTHEQPRAKGRKNTMVGHESRT
jgi:uncharacterized protein (DUF2252 family)